MVAIKQKDNGIEGMFYAVENGREIAEMSYYWAGDDQIVISSTQVADGHQGQGIGTQLVSKCVDFARKENVWIYPQCEFARQVFAQTPEYKDVLLR